MSDPSDMLIGSRIWRGVEFVTGFNLYRYGWRFFFRHGGCE